MKHTPTPWRQDPKGDNQIQYQESDERWYQIAKAFRGATEKETASANAAFIVRACNVHEELLEAAKTALQQLRPHGWRNEQDKATFEILKTAIAKAEGRVE